MAGSDRGVLFDVDGTLVDTNYLHTLAWWRALRDNGEQVHMSSIHRVIGMGSDRLVEELLGRPEPAASDGHKEQFRRLRDEMAAFPAAAAILTEVARRGAKVVLASSANEEDLEAMREAIGADEAIDQFTSSKDVEESKPSPDIFAVALEASGLDAENAMVVGDTVWDVKAARKSGLPCVCVLTGGISRQELEDAGAVAVYNDVGELLEQLDDSPLGKLLQGREEARA